MNHDTDETSTSEQRPDPVLIWPPGEVPVLGRYELMYRLGRGSHGVVFAAYDVELDREVALKVFRDDEPTHEIRREAMALTRSRHANVIALHDIGCAHTLSFLVMDIVYGQTMSDYMQSTWNSWHKTVSLFIQAAHGLEAVHQAGIAHADVKPGNLLLGYDGHVYVADFSLAREFESDTENRLGTRPYQAPERMRGAPADARADQFSLCVSLWLAIFGARPWTSNEAEVICSQAPAKARPRIAAPKQLERVLRRGLAVDPEHRFESMTALADALTCVLTLAGRRRVRAREVTLGLLVSLSTLAAVESIRAALEHG